MSRARSASTGRTYGRARVLKAWGLPRSTFYERRRRPLCSRPPARRGPKTGYSDEDLLVEIRRTIQESPFHGEGHRKVWARLRVCEVRTSMRRVLHVQFGSFAEGVARGVRLRHDHGSQFMSDDFQGEIAFLGMESSPAFVREPEGNGCIERFFRTLKEQLLWVRDFTTLEELAEALEGFRQRCNDHWLLERLSFQSPRQARQRLLALEAVA